MRSLRLHGPGDVRLVDEPEPVPGPGEQLVRVTAVGICGSDLHWYSEAGIGSDSLLRPLVLGHEAAGVIESGPNRGRRVAIDPAITCGACDQCLAGHGHFCRSLRFAGDGHTDGFLRELLAWPETSLVPVPDGLSDVDVAMLEPLGVALHAIRLGRIRPGARVGVFGCGPIGQFLIRLAHASGATTIVATDALAHRVAAAREAGATTAALFAGGSERAELLASTDGQGVEVAFEAAGENDAVETSMALASPGGTVVLVGIPAVDQTTFTASTARRKGLTIKLSRRMNRVYPAVIRLVEAQAVDVGPVVTATFPFSEAGAAFASASAREGLKVVVRL
jgi:L-iditol 2-dehydrogenase